MPDLKENSAGFLSWVHFGDLHLQASGEENHLDFLDLIEEVNDHLAGAVDFALLPGDNADDGTDPQYRLVRAAIDRLRVPVHAITGDHDRKTGSLALFRRYLENDLYRALDLRGFRLLFLNAMDGKAPTDFDFGSEQIEWLEERLAEARAAGLRPVIFTHLYPSELKTRAGQFSSLIRQFQLELVEMGHTHYNELANDGHTLYAATRSTGQIEEGPPGFSIAHIDGDVVSWKFKERGHWPFVVITSPADEKLIIRPASSSHVVRGMVPIRAKVWGRARTTDVACSVDDGPARPMQHVQDHWELLWPSSEVPDGIHRVSVHASGTEAEALDTISVLVNQHGLYTPPVRNPVDYENAIGAYPEKGIPGGQLGPNENGTKGPWPSWRKTAF